MKSATVFLCFGVVLLASACTKLDTTLEQAFAGDRDTTVEKPLFTPEPILTPGRYDLTVLKTGKSAERCPDPCHSERSEESP